MPRYEVGDAVILTTTVSVDGALTDATVALAVTHLASGVVSNPTVTHPGLGSYRATMTGTQLGEYQAVWTISGAAVGVQTDSFFVREPPILLCEIEDVEAAAHVAAGTYSGDATMRAAVEAAIIAVSSKVISACGGRKFIRRTWTEQFWVNGEDDDLTLTQRPVVSITSVTLDGLALDLTGYQSQAGLVRRLGWIGWGTWGDWSLATVVYVGGFLVPPDDIVDLVAQRVANGANNPAGLRQYSIGSFSATISAEALEGTGWTPSELDVLRAYGGRRTGMVRVIH